MVEKYTNIIRTVIVIENIFNVKDVNIYLECIQQWKKYLIENKENNHKDLFKSWVSLRGEASKQMTEYMKRDGSLVKIVPQESEWLCLRLHINLIVPIPTQDDLTLLYILLL